MRFENGFEVDAPVDEVWATVLDVEKVAPTVPGAQVLEQTGDNAYKVGIKVKLGPMTMQYKGDVEVVDADESSHRAALKVRAKESRGQGTADADVTMVLTGDESHTSGTITTDVKVSGKAASMGRGVMQDVAGRMVGTFAENLAEMLSGGPQEEDVPEATVERDSTTNGSAPGETEARAGAAEGGGAGGGTESGGEDSGDALDLGSIGGAMAADRLRDPRVLGVLLLIAFLLGRRSAR